MLTIKNVTKRYAKKIALDQVSFNIPVGSCYGLIGPNGAGKSTLLKIMASVIQDYQGEITMKGTSLVKQKMMIGYVPQEICLETNLSANSNLYFFGELYGLKGQTLKQRAQVILKEIGLEHYGKEKVANFSGGMKRRLNIGCALMNQPKFIIMDEPTVGIDPQSRRYIFQMIERLKQAGTTIVYATHYMEEVEQLCDELAFIDQSQIIEQGNLHELMEKYAVPAVFVKGRQIPTNSDAKYTEEWIEQDGGFLIKTDTPRLFIEKLLAFYLEHPADLERLEIVKPRLEDVFFSLTGTALRDESLLKDVESASTKAKEVIS